MTRLVPFLAAFLFLAAMRMSVRLEPEFPPHHVIHYVQEGGTHLLEGTVRGRPSPSNGWSRIPFQVLRLRSLDGSRDVTGRIDLFVNGQVGDVRTGDILLVEARLRRIRNLGNPGEFNRADRSFLKKIYAKGSVESPNHLLRLAAAPGYGFERWIHQLRLRLSSFLEQEPEGNGRGLLKTWLLGERSELARSTVENFRGAGVAHLLAISGLHVGLVGILVFGCLRLLLNRSIVILQRGWCTKLAAVGSLPIVFLYVLLAGGPVTAVRAGIMAALMTGCLLLDRPHMLWNALGLAALVLLLWDPSALFSISFQLSFVTVAALLASVRLWTPFGRRDSVGQRRKSTSLLGKALKGIKQTFLVSLTATAAAGPLAAFYFHRVTPLGIFANLVVVPLASWLVIPMGFISGLLSLFSPWMALPFLRMAGLGAGWTAAVAAFFAKLPGAEIPVGTPSLAEMVLYYLALFLVLNLRGSKRRKNLFLVCVSGFVLLNLLGFLGSKWSRHLEMTFLSVGNGDCTVIEFPGGERMVVDGGPARAGFYDAGMRIVAPFLRYRRIGRVDVLVASHGQADHYGGLRYLAEHFHPRELWIGSVTGKEEDGYPDFLGFCAARNMRVRSFCANAEPIFFGGTMVEFLHPPCLVPSLVRTTEEGKTGLINNNSLVMRLSLGRVRFLFTGDIEEGGEDMILRGEKGVDAFLLKVPHHGSVSSSSDGFLDRVDPSVAVISTAAASRYGFPSQRVLKRFRSRGVSIYRTDRDGAVCVRTDGHRVEVRSVLGKREVFEMDMGRPNPLVPVLHSSASCPKPYAECRGGMKGSNPVGEVVF